jgi:hypothetical protein
MIDAMLFDLPPVADGRGLFPVTNRGGRKLWCGPAALAAVSGWDAADTQEVCNRVSRRATRGLKNSELEKAARLIGVQLGPRSRILPRPTLQAWAEWAREPGSYIVNVTDHYVVVNGARFVDSSALDGCAVRDAWCKGRHVVGWWRVL